MDIDTKTYIALSVVMFLEYAIWGAWAPVLAARLLGPLKLDGKQTGWIYATLPLACIVSPLLAGWIGDQYLPNKFLLIGAHAIGAVMLFLAAKQTQFKPLLIVMLIYSFFYAATMPLVNAVLFAATADLAADAKGATQGAVFIWAPIAWALVGWTLTGWRMTRKEQGDGSDCLYFAAALSVLMVIGCFLLATVDPPKGGLPLLTALKLLQDPNLLLFFVVAMVVAGLMQFYFLGSAQFMQDNGISSKHVPASMALAQIAQAAATYFLLGYFLTNVGYQWTLVFGAGCWVVLYAIYALGRPVPLLIAAQPLHGLAYVFFIIVGQIFAESVADAAIRTTMQAVYFTATTGLGLFLGTQFAGWAMKTYNVQGKFQWPRIWMLPAGITLVGVIVLGAFFRNPPPADAAPAAEQPAAVSSEQPGD